MLDIDRAHDSDAGIENLEHVLPALGVRTRTRHVGVGELVDEGDLGLSGQHSGEVHLLECCAAVFADLARHDREVAYLLGGMSAAVGLDKADDDIRATLVAAPAFVEHRPGLADTGHSSQIDAELASRLDRLVGVVSRLGIIGVPVHGSLPTAPGRL